jgi:Carboxypeptidase regulatory-like domain/TonB dependent receptor
MKRYLGIALLCLLADSPAFAQAGFGGLAGTVTDRSQAVIRDASVSLTGVNGEVRTTRTNGSGNYLFTGLPVGSGYAIAVSAMSFQGAKVTGLSTTVGTVLTQNVVLAVGAETQTIEVTAASVEQVQTESSSISQLVDNTIFKDSPLEVRTQNTFVYLVAGAAGSGGSNRGAAMNGTRSGTGNFLMEGMDNNDQGQGGAGFTYGAAGAVASISPDAIQEYRVITHNPSAEYGRAGGFSTDTVLKSGGNRFHGSLFEYNRVQALAAENWFSNFNGLHDQLIRNQFGGSLGGPIYRDKTFFYASVEMHHLRQGGPVEGTVTTQAFLDFVNSGAFETFQETDAKGLCMQYNNAVCPGGFSSSHTLGPVFKSLLAAEPGAFPLGTQQGTGVAGGLYTGGAVTYPVPVYANVGKTQSSPTNQNRASMKIDHKLTERDQLGFSYLLDFVNTSKAFAGGGATFGPDRTFVGGAQLFTGNWTHTFSPSLQNLFRLGYTRHVSNFNSPGVQGVPMIFTMGDPLASGFGANSAYPQLFTENEFLYEDSLTKDVGRHSLKAGLRYMRTRNGSSFYNDFNGTLAPYDVESLVTDETFDDQADRVVYGAPTYGSLYMASASIDTTTNLAPNPYRGFRANEFAAYVQDDWRVTSRLVVNAGLRWEYFGPPHNAVAGLDSNVFFGAFVMPTPNGNPFLPNSTFIGAMQGATFQGVPNGQHSTLWNRDTNNFAPRVGFSYDPTGTGKVAIRGGFGIGYDRLYNNAYENIRFNSPHYSDNSIGAYINGVVAGEPDQGSALIAVPFTANNLFVKYGGLPVPRHVDERLATAYYEQANFGMEKEIAKGYVAEVNYVGTFGRKLIGGKDANTFDGRNACPHLTVACKAAGYTTVTNARPNSLFGADNFRTSGFNSNYNGLQASVRKDYSHGLMFLANYTYSKAMDETSDLFVSKTGEAGITDPTNPAYDYGPADFDVRHMATVTMNYESQWRRKNLLLGGWTISPLLSLQSGTPFSTTDSSSVYNPNKDGRPGYDRAVYIGPGSYKNAIVHNARPLGPGYVKANQFAAYACPTSVNFGLWCDPPMSRNAFYGPGYANVDVAVSKRILLTEAQRLIGQVAFFNVMNHPNFGNPGSDINNPLEFGLAQATNNGQSTGSRVTQLSLRYEF